MLLTVLSIYNLCSREALPVKVYKVSKRLSLMFLPVSWFPLYRFFRTKETDETDETYKNTIFTLVSVKLGWYPCRDTF